ncbi:MAG: transcriptional regulator, partial [Candidatus Latescibacteria bacterium]|nr:transcriptional regulator [Candidatus Latescibacterota bacterium]MCK5527134.1 transcriptional regulator [Candidatus Latescibacterota bacterium]
STGQVPDKLKLLSFCRQERSIKEMMAFLNRKHRETFSINTIHPLMENNLIAMTIPDKPKSPKQKYRITSTGLKELGDH